MDILSDTNEENDWKTSTVETTAAKGLKVDRIILWKIIIIIIFKTDIPILEYMIILYFRRRI